MPAALARLAPWPQWLHHAGQDHQGAAPHPRPWQLPRAKHKSLVLVTLGKSPGHVRRARWATQVCSATGQGGAWGALHLQQPRRETGDLRGEEQPVFQMPRTNGGIKILVSA